MIDEEMLRSKEARKGKSMGENLKRNDSLGNLQK